MKSKPRTKLHQFEAKTWS